MKQLLPELSKYPDSQVVHVKLLVHTSQFEGQDTHSYISMDKVLATNGATGGPIGITAGLIGAGPLPVEEV